MEHQDVPSKLPELKIMVHPMYAVPYIHEDRCGYRVCAQKGKREKGKERKRERQRQGEREREKGGRKKQLLFFFYDIYKSTANLYGKGTKKIVILILFHVASHIYNKTSVLSHLDLVDTNISVKISFFIIHRKRP